MPAFPIFSEDVLPRGKATWITQPYIGYKVLACCRDQPVPDLAIAELIIPRGTTIYRPSIDPIERSDLRCDRLEVREIRAIRKDQRISIGFSPCFTGEYRVKGVYEEKSLDIKTDEDCRPGLHFFTTKERAIEYALMLSDLGYMMRHGSDAIIGTIAKLCKWSPNDLLAQAVNVERVDIIKMAIDRGADNFEYAYRVVRRSNHPYAPELLGKMKAAGCDLDLWAMEDDENMRLEQECEREWTAEHQKRDSVPSETDAL